MGGGGGGLDGYFYFLSMYATADYRGCHGNQNKNRQTVKVNEREAFLVGR